MVPISHLRRQRFDPKAVERLKGALERQRQAQQAAGLVHILGESKIPDSQPGGDYSDRSFLGSWNGVPLHAYVTYVLRWGHGGMGDGGAYTSMTYPGHNAQQTQPGKPYLCKVCVVNGIIASILGGDSECAI